MPPKRAMSPPLQTPTAKRPSAGTEPICDHPYLWDALYHGIDTTVYVPSGADSTYELDHASFMARICCGAAPLPEHAVSGVMVNRYPDIDDQGMVFAAFQIPAVMLKRAANASSVITVKVKRGESTLTLLQDEYDDTVQSVKAKLQTIDPASAALVQQRLDAIRPQRRVDTAGRKVVDVKLVDTKYYIGKRDAEMHELRVVLGGNYHLQTIKLNPGNDATATFQVLDGLSDLSGNVLVVMSQQTPNEPHNGRLWVTPIAELPVRELYAQLVTRIITNDPNTISVVRHYPSTDETVWSIDTLELPKIAVFCDDQITRWLRTALGPQRKNDETQALLTLARCSASGRARMTLEAEQASATFQLNWRPLNIYEADHGQDCDTVSIYRQIASELDGAKGGDTSRIVYYPAALQRPCQTPMQTIATAHIWGPLANVIRDKQRNRLTLFVRVADGSTEATEIIVGDREETMCLRVLTTSVLAVD